MNSTIAVGQGTPTESITTYWNTHIHDLAIVSHPVGSHMFFQELEAYRFSKLRYLPRLVQFEGYRGRDVLEVGCGLGIDLARFARGGALVAGIDLSETAIRLARQNLERQGLPADLRVMDGEALQYEANSFDVVYAHGVLPYTADPARLINEVHRVLRPGGEAILMAYNRHSWLRAMSSLMRVPLEHEDAPVLRMFTVGELRRMLKPFARLRIIPERFPVETRLHRGLKAALYNSLFVPAFRLLPRPLVRLIGWHLIAFAGK